MMRVASDEEGERMNIYGLGLSDKGISDKLGMPRTTITSWRNSRKLPANKGIPKTKLNTDGMTLKKLYVSEKKSTYEIGKIFGVNSKTVYSRLKRLGIPLRGKCWPFDPDPTRELSYLLGVFYGDGYVSKTSGSYRFALAVNDEDFIIEFKRALSRTLGKKPSIFFKHKHRYYCGAVSKKMYQFLKLGLDSHKPIIERYPADFLRGFFDSEGSAIKGNRANPRIREVRVACKNKVLIELCHRLLSNLGIKSHVYEYHYTGFSRCLMHLLIISAREEVGKFAHLVGFSIGRKREKLEEFLRA